MDDKTKELLVKAIEKGFEDLEQIEDESEEKSEAVENIVKLYKLKIEENRNEAQAKNDLEIRNKDLELKENQMKNDLKVSRKELRIKENQINEQSMDRWVNFGIQVGLGLVGIFAYDRWYRRGLKFEETGTITAPMTRNLLSKMLPKK